MLNVHLFFGPSERTLKAARDGEISPKCLRACLEICAPVRWWRELGCQAFDKEEAAKRVALWAALRGVQMRDFSFEARGDFTDHNDGIGGEDELPQYGFPEPGLSWEDEEAYRDAYFYRDGPYEVLADALTYFGKMYMKTDEPKWLKAIEDLLPESYNHTQAVSLTYKQLKKAIKRSRKADRCPEWDEFEAWLKENAPGAEFLGLGEEK